jgi:hypothetical protein
MQPCLLDICSTAFFPALQCDIGVCVPVRPRTRVTLTSLTGALAVSMMCDCVVDGNRSFVWS